MEFVDTHAHLYSEEFDGDRNEVIERALAAGVSHILLPDVDASSRAAMLSMAERYPCCSFMLGLHPTSVNDNPAWREEINAIGNLLEELRGRV